MHMFLVLMTYKKALEEIDHHLAEHRAFLDRGYKENYFVVSGPKKPRTGGIILSQLNDRNQLEAILKEDPFHIHSMAGASSTSTVRPLHPNASAILSSIQLGPLMSALSRICARITF